MNSNTNSIPERQVAPDFGGVASLQAEIEFWNEIIAMCPLSQPAECVERMHQALALAEFKLAKTLAKPGSDERPSSRNH